MSNDKTDAYHKISVTPPDRPSACPVDHDFTPFDADYLRDPYAQLEHLNAQQPIFYSDKLKSIVVTRLEDVLEVFKRHEIFSSENVQDPVFPVCPRAVEILSAEDFDPVAVMSNRQQPDHTRIRKYTREGFSARRMKILEPYIRDCSDTLIDSMLAKGGPADFVTTFAHPLPGQIIFRFIGFPESDYEQLIAWTSNRLVFTWGKPSDVQQEEIAANMLHYWRYCRAFVAKRRLERGDDYTSELLTAQEANSDELSYREVESVVYGLSFAGHEIVSNYLANSLLCLLSDRNNWRAIISKPDLIGNMLEEVLRFESPQTSWRRIAKVDTSLGGIDIPAGTRIFLSLGAANHQADEFENPSTFDIQRENAAKHISFGHGIHFCLGARLARIEAQIAIEALSQRIPSIQLVPDQELQWSPNMTFRGPQKLLVDWQP
ncbi:MAG: cytochrome P450 [Gammaproteobacteria bacterium]|jgi:cytochrome P450